MTVSSVRTATKRNPFATRAPAIPQDSIAQTGEYSDFRPHALGRPVRGARAALGFTLVLFGVATLIAILYSVERYFYSRLVGEARLAAQARAGGADLHLRVGAPHAAGDDDRQALPGVGTFAATPQLGRPGRRAWSRSSSCTSRSSRCVMAAIAPGTTLQSVPDVVRQHGALVDRPRCDRLLRARHRASRRRLLPRLEATARSARRSSRRVSRRRSSTCCACSCSRTSSSTRCTRSRRSCTRTSAAPIR